MSQHYDVVVVGGGAAGLAAAVGAARCGARSLLIEQYGFLGGAATNAGVLAYCGFYTQGDQPRLVTGGVGTDLLRALSELGIESAPRRSTTGNWIIMLDAEATKLAFDRTLLGSKAELLLHATLTGAEVEGGRITRLRVASLAGPSEITASAFVDASGDAALWRASLPAPPTGNPHPQPGSLPVRFGGVTAPSIDRTLLAKVIAEGFPEAPESHAAVRRDGGFMFRLPLSGDFWWLAIDLDTGRCTPEELTRAELAGRELAARSLAVLRRAMPGFEHAYLAATGPQIGIRESYRGETRYVITTADAETGRLCDDAVACAGWPLELHHGVGRIEYRPLGGQGHFHVPQDGLRATRLDNLWFAGRTIGCEPGAFGSLRVMGTAFATGHAAGVAAAGFAASGAVSVPEIRKELLAQGAIL